MNHRQRFVIQCESTSGKTLPQENAEIYLYCAQKQLDLLERNSTRRRAAKIASHRDVLRIRWPRQRSAEASVTVTFQRTNDIPGCGDINNKHRRWFGACGVNSQGSLRLLILSALDFDGINYGRRSWSRCRKWSWRWCRSGYRCDLPNHHHKRIVVIFDTAAIINLQRIGCGEITGRSIASNINIRSIGSDAPALIS